MEDSNYSEAALLAALPKAPSKYNPYRYPEVAKFVEEILVIQNLADNNFVSKNIQILKDSNLNLKKKN